MVRVETALGAVGGGALSECLLWGVETALGALGGGALSECLLWGACFDSDLFCLSWRCSLLSYILNSQCGYPSPS